jgi:hypothetical protein
MEIKKKTKNQEIDHDEDDEKIIQKNHEKHKINELASLTS